MDNTNFLRELLEELNPIISSKNQVNELAEILTLEKASVYRRLSGKIPFSFFEVALLARKTGISLDKITNRSPIPAQTFVLPNINYVNPSPEDYEIIDQHVDLLKSMSHLENRELTEACNLLPLSLSFKYEHIMRFYTFKWFYQHETSSGNYLYKKILIPESLKKLHSTYYTMYKSIIQRSHYIFDYLMFYYIVNDLKYFAFLGLISPQELSLLKNDLISLLQEIETIASTGKDTETGNEIYLYISNINLETNYASLTADGFQLVLLKLFLLCAAGSLEKRTSDQVKNWLESLKRHSTLISGCNEAKSRRYFEEQKLLIEKL